MGRGNVSYKGGAFSVGRYGVGYTSEHERTPVPPSIPIKAQTPRGILRRSLCMIMSLMVASVNFFALLNLGVFVSEYYIIEGCVSRWKVELRGLDLGPAPSWLDDPPSDFDHLPPGADEYANFSLDLSIENNPEWLHVEFLDLQVAFHGGTLVVLFPRNSVEPLMYPSQRGFALILSTSCYTYASTMCRGVRVLLS
ncbi:hypothetical protein FOZ60_007371 [Perkinsus olseni]|uniref:Uncharacterized protein n=1 Tax=Perkinsus olseni TaxID=32597 RepID=A0A7J6NLF6_PEROL|nr:hypothetical protein FOZ60_007371 [Perkinsus olseni]